MRKYILFTLALIVSSQVWAELTTDLYKKANAFYQKSEYTKAIAEYEKVLSQGFESAELYYNLGNAYYKTSNYSSAILNYERAKKLAPNDEDISVNLRLANLNVIDKVEPESQFYLKSGWNSLADQYSVDEWTLINLVVFYCTIFVAIFFVITRSSALKKVCFVFGLLLFSASGVLYSLTSTRYEHQYKSMEAIVFASSSYVKSSPAENGADLFIIHEGTKVKVLDQVGEWVKIHLENGSEGWIVMQDVRHI